MPYKPKYTFEVKYLQILDEKGTFDAEHMPKLSEKELGDLYLWLYITRHKTAVHGENGHICFLAWSGGMLCGRSSCAPG